jgi:hypothetical protein
MQQGTAINASLSSIGKSIETSGSCGIKPKEYFTLTQCQQVLLEVIIQSNLLADLA